MDQIAVQLIAVLIGFGFITWVIWFVMRIFREPAYGAALLFFFLPFERLPSLDIAGTTIRINHFVGGLTLVAWLVLIILRRRQIRSQPLAPLITLLIAALIVAIPGAEHMTRAVTVTLFTLFTISLGMLVPQLVTQRDELRKIVGFLFFSAALTMAFGLYQFIGDLAGLPSSFTGLAEGYGRGVFGFPRIQSVGHEPLFYANFLLLPISLVLAFLVLPQKWFSQKILWIFLSLLLITLALTLSRGAIIGFLGAAGFLAVTLAPRLITLRNVFVIGVVGVLVLGAVGGILRVISPEATSRFVDQLTIQDFGRSDSTVGRLRGWNDAITLWKTSPVVGIGPGNYGPAILGYPATPPAGGWPVVNNEYIEILAEMGLLGLGIFLTFLLSLFARSYQALTKPGVTPEVRATIMGLTAALFGMLIQYNFFSTLYITPIWLTFGILIAVQSIALGQRQPRGV